MTRRGGTSSGPGRAEGQAAPEPSDGAGILVRDVTVTYRNGHTALRHASFAIPTGTVTALVGVNGGGKSTLFKAIMGFVRLGSGEIRLLGGTVREALCGNLVAYVPQAEEVDWSFPVLVEDVVMMGRYGHMGFLRRPGPADRAAVATALERVGMTEFRHRQIGELSGGQRKRVFLARALAQDARVILLDEPFTGVDVKTEDAIVALLRALRDEGRVMLVATHNLGSVPEFCDRVVLVRGTVLDYGPTATTFTAANLERTFGGVLRHFVLPDEAGEARRIVTDDERPLVFRGEAHAQRPPEPEAPPQDVPEPDAHEPEARRPEVAELAAREPEGREQDGREPQAPELETPELETPELVAPDPQAPELAAPEPGTMAPDVRESVPGGPDPAAPAFAAQYPAEADRAAPDPARRGPAVPGDRPGSAVRPPVSSDPAAGRGEGGR